MQVGDEEQQRYNIEDVKQHEFFAGVKFASYEPLDIDIMQSLREKWIWDNVDVFLSKCMHEEIPSRVDHVTVDRYVCDNLKFKLLDNF